ncbi:MAG TPA: polysaccharide biosynthesis/export family protein [Pyrinomonadaceae bacterium]|jgi:protein involved in polysaccharide export with SLBB domain|nr:polysaccharide biosynthesis/export family protein [Pyrinomonadaceae bacterium]
MKSSYRLAATLSLALLALSPAARAQEADRKKDADAQRQQQQQQRPAVKPGERLEPDDATPARPDVPQAVLEHRREQINEDSDSEIPSYNNFMSSYRLGPEDVISVTVFELPKYSKTGIVVPPHGTIDYYLIRGGLFVNGKTTQQVADEITQHLDEYIIDPKVTVSLDKAMSQRYGVLGDVAQPGIRPMTRRLSVYEALNEAGGILRTGKKRVVVLHWDADRMLKSVTIDVAAIEKGKAPDNYFLRPGDQIFVPGNKWKTVDQVLKALPIISFARIFTGGF